MRLFHLLFTGVAGDEIALINPAHIVRVRNRWAPNEPDRWEGISVKMVTGDDLLSPLAMDELEPELERWAAGDQYKRDAPAAPAPDTGTPADNCRRYMEALNALEIAPNGDDCNALFDLVQGGPYSPPHINGR